MSLHVEVAVLNKISHLVARRTSVQEMLSEVLKILHVEMGLLRGTVTLREGDVLVIEASEGLSRSEIDRGLYRVGEGITGTVVSQGKGRIIPDISKEKGFLNRTKARDNQKHRPQGRARYRLEGRLPPPRHNRDNRGRRHIRRVLRA